MLRQVWPSLRQYLCRRPSLSRLVVYSLITTVTLIGGLLLSPYSASFRSMLPSNLFFPPSSGPSESSGDLPRVSLWPRGHVPLAVGEEPPDTPSLIPFLPEPEDWRGASMVVMPGGGRLAGAGGGSGLGRGGGKRSRWQGQESTSGPRDVAERVSEYKETGTEGQIAVMSSEINDGEPAKDGLSEREGQEGTLERGGDGGGAAETQTNSPPQPANMKTKEAEMLIKQAR
ncbi:hypothetical protein NSK_008140 [Nannochloropsis salina CCMP1776]|uniref:Uncharacterized protein n=1 Tax=Nannochloropsis salina CCMP1776 TaxID=1027361 RepID=A0A4D9CUS2_9STRA|nr:hypothetical protein NSK_008140 [Nannochloropsis salina CCMP1776]|eukprot:TFJ80399.1 hypothetical protein NSK_008140 [Nannochloropsis salina CCMP1776]